MRNSRFFFKQFAVEQSGAAMKIGTDGVLLGAWVVASGAERVLDIGTGTGVIALMVAQRCAAKSIVGIDIEQGAVECAAENFKASPWSDRLSAEHSSVQEYCGAEFDLVVTNPPYFTDSLLCPEANRTTARHTISLSFEELDSAVCRLLDSRVGRFALILPTEQMERYLALTRLSLVRRCDIRSRANSEVIRTMAELSVVPAESVEQQSLVIYQDQGREYTAQYRELTKDFYLKF